MALSLPTPIQIRDARKRLHLTLQQAADMAGLGAGSRWAEYESGARSPDVERWEMFLLRAGQHPTHRLTRRPATRKV